MTMYRIVETDNFDSDYPCEKFLDLPPLGEWQAKEIAAAINRAVGKNCQRYWKVVPEGYVLQPGFEP